MVFVSQPGLADYCSDESIKSQLSVDHQGNTLKPFTFPEFQPLTWQEKTVSLYEKNYSWQQGGILPKIDSRSLASYAQVSLEITVAGKKSVVTFDKFAISGSKNKLTVNTLSNTDTGLTVKAITDIEPDGFMTVRLNILADTPTVIDEIALVADVLDSASTEILAFKTQGIRRQKNRSDILQPPYKGSFLNAVSIGDSERAFWWFADNAQGWIWNGPHQTELLKVGNKIRLRQLLLANSASVSAMQEIKFGMLATPIKQLAADWRERRILWGAPSAAEKQRKTKYKIWWPNAFSYDAFPYVDYPGSTASKLNSKNIKAYKGLATNRKIVRDQREKYGINWIPYFSAHTLTTLDPVLQKCLRQWKIQPEKIFKDGLNPYSNQYPKYVLTHRAHGYSNYIVDRFDELIDELDIVGIYLDHGPVHDSNNLANGGWYDSNGKLQSSLDIFATREFLKNLRRKFLEKGKAGHIFIHISNREILPAYTYAYALINGEQYRRDLEGSNYLDIVSLDEFRTRFATANYGFITIWLPLEWVRHIGDKHWLGSDAQLTAYRKVMGLALAHDLLDWPQGSHQNERGRLIAALDKFGVANAVFEGYWLDSIPLLAKSEQIKTSSYSKPGGRFLILTNTSSQPVISQLLLTDKQSLKGATLRDENGTIINANHTIKLKPYGFTWITLE